MLKRLLEQSGTSISIDEITQMICVTEPYYQLEDVTELEPGLLKCNVRPEQEAFLEQGELSIAEAGRHLAILGSIAAARQNPVKEKHYYLAVEADLQRLSCVQDLPPKPSLQCQGLAELVSFSKREAVVRGTMSYGPEALFSLEVRYKIIPFLMFRRIFKHFEKEEVLLRKTSPYQHLVSLEVDPVEGKKLHALLPEVKAEMCMGHFDQFPGLPIAIMGGTANALAGRLFRSLLGQDSAPFAYFVRQMKGSAPNLGFTGHSMDFTLEHVGVEGTLHEFKGIVKRDDGVLCGEMFLSLERAEA